jgi:N-acetylglucosamine-6-phosphate deacetylase
VNYPLGDFGRTEPPKQPKLVAFKNATLWTCGPAGTIERGTLVIGEGKIIAAGADVEVPAGAEVIDAEGRHISPGIIDCHSHMATDGGINEMAQAITAEVRIGDFIDPDDITIYRQLAGGVTSSNILHGSANPIGGQNQVIKLRWGAGGEEMKFAGAPPGIKFALGENVKQSNLEGRQATRYPQSRMGVEQIIRDAFAAARDYTAAWERWNASHTGLPPRRDLELEAIAEILAHRRWVHCHSYRQDEILALIRTFDDNGITIGSLQHILEGYKVADAMARHGATGSSFADWWAYKIEVYDAIPYNGALMHRQGIIVSFNSDDQELGRHLNHEAAKAVKYGGVPRDEALKFVTLNPARQLRIDRWVGSLEAGKQADFVVWSRDPLSVRSRCEATWIDGRKYFDRSEDRRLRDEQAKMRFRLIRKVLESGQAMQRAADREPEEWELWPRHDEACHAGDEDHHH